MQLEGGALLKVFFLKMIWRETQILMGKNQVIRILVDCINKGGNLLLDVGPKADGTIPDEQVNILKELGRWTRKHAEAIYGSRAGIPFEHYYGPTALNKKGDILYLFVPHKPNGSLILKGIKNKVQQDFYVRMFAKKVSMRESQVYDEISRLNLPSSHPSKSVKPIKTRVSASDLLMGFLWEYPDLYGDFSGRYLECSGKTYL